MVGKFLRAGFHVRQDICRTGDDLEGCFPLEHELLGSEFAVAHLAHHLGQVNGVLRFVIRRDGKRPRQVRVVAVFVQLFLGALQVLLGLAKRNGREATDACAVGIGQEATCLREVFSLDGHELGIAIKRGRFNITTLGPLEVTPLEQADSVAELALRIGPELRRELGRARIRGVLATLHDLREGSAGELGGFCRRIEILRRFGRILADELNVRAPLEVVLGVAVFLHAPFPVLRRE